MSVLERKLPLMCDQHMCILGWKLNEIVDALYKKDPSSVDVVPRISSPDGDFILNGFHRTINALTEHLGIVDFPQLNMMDDYQMRRQHTHLNHIIEKVNGLKIEPSIKHIAQLNGATHYWQLSEEIQLPVGYSYEMDVLYDVGNQAAIDYLATGEGGTESSLFFVSKEFVRVGSSGRLSIPVVDGADSQLRYDGQFHTVSVTSQSNLTTVGILGARFNYTRNCSGIIKMFRVKNSNGVVINEIPLTNKTQGATQLATVGDINATMVGYTESVWKEDT